MKKQRSTSDLEYKKPENLDGFDEIQEQIIQDKRKAFFPDALRIHLRKYISRSYYKSELKKAKMVKVSQREIETISNMDWETSSILGQNYYRHQKTKKEFSDRIVTAPVIMYSRKENVRWIMSGRDTVSFVIRKLGKYSFKVVQINV